MLTALALAWCSPAARVTTSPTSSSPDGAVAVLAEGLGAGDLAGVEFVVGHH